MLLSHLCSCSSSSCFSANNEMGLLTTLLRWNDLDPPSREEKLRNERVCKFYQHNRNPFIDHPEYASLIWEQVPQSRESSYTHRLKNRSSNSTRTIKRDNWEVRLKYFGLNYQKKKLFWFTILEVSSFIFEVARLTICWSSNTKLVEWQLVTLLGLLRNAPSGWNKHCQSAQGWIKLSLQMCSLPVVNLQHSSLLIGRQSFRPRALSDQLS